MIDPTLAVEIQSDALITLARTAYQAFHGGTPPLCWSKLPACSQLKWIDAAGAAIAYYQGYCAEVRS